MYLNRFLRQLAIHLKKIGISEKEQKKRKLVFHSFRHYLNTVLVRTLKNERMVRNVTGHKVEAMTENYFHQTEEELEIVRGAISESVIPLLSLN
jgi:integrase